MASSPCVAPRGRSTLRPPRIRKAEVIIFDDLVSTATRFNKWTEVQDLVKSDAAQATMQAARRNFGGARYVPLDGSVFFEAIVEDNDLMPIRYFELGRIAARAVGRFISTSDQAAARDTRPDSSSRPASC